jgi:formyltetrahydrofolate deformylase
MTHGVLTVTCPDRPGIIAAVAGFLAERGANIVDAQQHSEHTGQRFFLRVEFEPFANREPDLRAGFETVASAFSMTWQLRFTDRPRRLGIMVSKFDHCLLDLIWRQRAGEIPAEIPLVISNHPDLQPVVEGFGIRYEHLPITRETKEEQERRELDLFAEAGVEFVAMARYMQVLSPVFLAGYPLQVINVHHGLLPSFAGARPYEQARDRGVKVVGATAHYATEVLDDGPIIDQEVVHVTHRDTVADLVRKGRDAERLVLARAVRAHAEDRVFVDGRRTVVL